MEAELLKIVGQVSGIGGIALGVFLLLFRDIIGKSIFPRLKRDDAYRLLRFIAMLVWSVAIVGLGAWGWVEHSPTVKTEGGVTARGDINARDIIVKYGLDDSEITRLVEASIEEKLSAVFEQVTNLAHKLSITEATVTGLIAILGKKQVSSDRRLKTFAEMAGRVIQFRETPRTADPQHTPSPDLKVGQLEQQAALAVEEGRFDQAEDLLGLALRHLDQELVGDRVRVAETHARIGDLKMIRLDYAGAAEKYMEAIEAIAQSLPQQRADYVEFYAEALRQLGRRRPDIDTLRLAVGAFEEAVWLRRQGRDICSLARAQSNLGNAQLALVQWTAETKALNQAVVSYRMSLAPFDRGECDWRSEHGTIIANLAQALTQLAKKTSDSAPANEAVQLLKPLLITVTSEKDGGQRARILSGLASALATLADLGAASGGSADDLYEQAIQHYRAALMDMSRTQLPEEWGVLKNNVGYYMAKLGFIRRDETMIIKGVDELGQALDVLVSPPHNALRPSFLHSLGFAFSALSQVTGARNCVIAAATVFHEGLAAQRSRGQKPGTILHALERDLSAAEVLLQGLHPTESVTVSSAETICKSFSLKY